LFKHCHSEEAKRPKNLDFSTTLRMPIGLMLIVHWLLFIGRWSLTIDK